MKNPDGLKQYIVFVRDHSGSMSSIRSAAAKDYNDNIAVFKEQANESGIDTIVSVVKCGTTYKGIVERTIINSSVAALKEISEREYNTDGSGTPLFDSVGDAIEIIEAVPDFNNPKCSFLVMVTTDGEENSSSQKWLKGLGAKIKQLQATDRWTFVFRVPHGSSHALTSMGIPAGNILEWEQTTKGMQKSTSTNASAVRSYYTQRTTGATASKSFYTDLSDVSLKEVKHATNDITKEIMQLHISAQQHEMKIQDFVVAKTNKPFVKGTAFYQLTKTEKEVQDYKQIILRDRSNNKFYGGAGARQLLGLPTKGSVRLVPKDCGQYDVFVQSTSLNRKVAYGTVCLLWEAAAIV